MTRNKKRRNDKFIIGYLSVNTRGFGFVTPETAESKKDSDIFIPADSISTALHGDKVKVKLTPPWDYRGKPEGKIIKVLERATTTVVGTYSIIDTFDVVEPDDMRISRRIILSNAKTFKNLKPGMKIVVEITKYASPITGIVTEILGKRKEPGVDILAVIRRYGIVEEFPQEVLESAANVEKEVSKEEKSKRVSRRKLKIVTIDGEDAKDLDDGVYAERYSTGEYFLGVYIADVSHYVKANTPLDIEAFERGTSIYPVDRVVPMLPKELSNGICSLNAGVDRLAMACEMILDKVGNVKKYEIFPTVIHVHKRLTYTAVNDLFNKGEADNLNDIAPMLSTLRDICELRKKIRFKRGAIDFDLAEIKVLLDSKGRPTDIVKRERNLAESVIEECMLTANETVAKHMYDLQRPFIYRVHEQPDSDKVDNLNSLLATFGLHINKRNDGSVRPMDIQKVLNKFKGTNAEKIISNVALRSMQQAHYTADYGGHFGLAAQYYTHFTSPIRRYPDLIVHRLLRETFNNTDNRKISKKQIEKVKATLASIARQSSERERRAVEIERETTDLKSVEYMQKFVGKYLNGVIVSVTKFGFFVELANGVDGLVRLSSMVDDYYIYVESEFAIVGELSGKTFKIGDEVRVKLIEANVALRQITFNLAGKVVKSEELIAETGDKSNSESV
ncbi:MAG: ribonuclease R [Selenomonadaceae bacterium]|nr:ribonuclease R [Selenomonadaceae bacterium]